MEDNYKLVVKLNGLGIVTVKVITLPQVEVTNILEAPTIAVAGIRTLI